MEEVRSLASQESDVTVLAQALGEACGGGHLETVRVLVSAGADVKARLRGGYTPLHVASWQGHLPVVQVLLESGADVNARDDRGATPLYLALDGIIPWTSDEPVDAPAHLALLGALLSHGADPHARTERGDSPWDLVARVRGPGVDVLRAAMQSRS